MRMHAPDSAKSGSRVREGPRATEELSAAHNRDESGEVKRSVGRSAPRAVRRRLLDRSLQSRGPDITQEGSEKHLAQDVLGFRRACSEAAYADCLLEILGVWCPKVRIGTNPRGRRRSAEQHPGVIKPGQRFDQFQPSTSAGVQRALEASVQEYVLQIL